MLPTLLKHTRHTKRRDEMIPSSFRSSFVLHRGHVWAILRSSSSRYQAHLRTNGAAVPCMRLQRQLFHGAPIRSSMVHPAVLLVSDESPAKNFSTVNSHQDATVTNVLDTYTEKERGLLKPYQVAFVWSNLLKAAKAIPKSERGSLWWNHGASIQILMDDTKGYVSKFNGRATATIAYSLSQLILLSSESMNDQDIESFWNYLLLQTTNLTIAGGFDGRQLSNLLWSFAKVQQAGTIRIDERLLEAQAKAAEKQLDELEPQGLANIVWAIASIGHSAPVLFDAVAEKAQEQMHEFNPQDLSNMVWAFATMRHYSTALFDSVADRAQKSLDHFPSQGLANLVWAFAKLEHESPALLDGIAKASQQRINEFNPQGLSNLVWAFATMGHEAQDLFHAIALRAIVCLTQFSPQGLANTSWAFAKMKDESPGLFDAIAEKSQLCLDKFVPQNLSNMAWAFATLKHESPALFDGFAARAQLCLDDFKPQELSNMAWAFASLKHESPTLFDNISSRARSCVDEFKPQEVSYLAWAFATLQHRTPLLFDAIARKAKQNLDKFSPEDLSNFAWAFAVIDHQSEAFTALEPSLIEALSSSFDPDVAHVEHLIQLHQFQLWCEQRNKVHALPDPLKEACKRAFISTVST